MLRRARHQNGSLQRVKRRTGPDVWTFLWYETDINGRRRRRKTMIGSVEQYPTESSAQNAIGALRLTINQEAPREMLQPISVGELITHYQNTELNLDADPQEEEKSYSTKETYRIVLERWIRPRWGKLNIREVRTVAVEEWLKKLTLPDGKRMARGTKSKIRGVMHTLYNHAIRYEWVQQGTNPISMVRQSAKREHIPDILEVAEFHALLQELPLRERTLVVLDAMTGLRRSELVGLKWLDIDFEKLQINVMRSVVHQVVGKCKTEASQRPVPLDPVVAEDLWLWKQTTPYSKPADWVFASERMNGKQPLWPDSLLSRRIKPAARKVGIEKQVGWHTFRHTYSTLLKANGEDVKVVQELLRHANSKVTLDTYIQAPSTAKRQAQSRVVSMMLPKKIALSNQEALMEPFGTAASERSLLTD